MPAARTQPTTEHLQRFLLGELTDAEAEPVEAWMNGCAESAAILRQMPAEDTITRALATVPATGATPSPDVERVIRTVTVSLGTGEPARKVALVPTRFGEYRIVRLLGAGGMGVVYEAEDERLHRRVAIKVMHPHLAANEAARQRFMKEARGAAALDSEYIVPIHHVGEAEGAPYMVMKYLEGSTLDDWLKAHPGAITVEEVIWVARDALLGLAEAHRKGLVHRDIKPQNLWIERDVRRVKTLDFGLIQGQAGENSLTPEGVIVGTPEYMAPEQANLETVDARADLFSLGVVLYRMVAGQSPFRRETALATLAALATVTPPPLHGVPREVGDFITGRLMARDPARRPGDASMALAELQRVAEQLQAKPANRGPRRRWPIAIAITGLMAVLLTVIILIIRDKNGKSLVLIDLSDEVAKGVKVTVIIDEEVGHPWWKRLLPPPPPPGENRVVVIANVQAFADHKTDKKYIHFDRVAEGTTGVEIGRSLDKLRVHIRLDGPQRHEVWIWSGAVDKVAK